MIHSFLLVMIDTSAEQKDEEQHIILKYEPMRKQNVFHGTHIPPILNLGVMEYFNPTIFLSDATVYNYSKLAVMTTSDYIKTAYRDLKIFMQVTQCCVFIRHFIDV